MTGVIGSVGDEADRHIPPGLRRKDLGHGIVIRIAEPSEYTEVGEVLVEAFTHGCWSTPWYLERLRRVDERAHNATVWVAADSEGVLGAVLTPMPHLHPGQRFTFNILGVGLRGRGRGLGDQLTAHVITLARELGYQHIEIHSGEQMTAAHAIYYRHGFVRRHDWETLVVDGGQRLHTYTLRISTDQQRSAEGADMHETTPVRLDGTHDRVGRFVPTAPTATLLPQPWPASGVGDLVVPVDSPAGWPVLLAARFTGHADRLRVLPVPGTGAPRLLDASGVLVSDDPADLLWALVGVSEPSDSASLDRTVRADVVGGLLTALFGADVAVREAALRVFYARLGQCDLDLAHQRALGGDQWDAADFTLFGVVIGFDRWYRRWLGWGVASIIDYPHLWRWARELFQSGLVTSEDRVWLGLEPDDAGERRRPWGEPAPVEGVDDLDTVWDSPE